MNDSLLPADALGTVREVQNTEATAGSSYALGRDALPQDAVGEDRVELAVAAASRACRLARAHWDSTSAGIKGLEEVVDDLRSHLTEDVQRKFEDGFIALLKIASIFVDKSSGPGDLASFLEGIQKVRDGVMIWWRGDPAYARLLRRHEYRRIAVEASLTQLEFAWQDAEAALENLLSVTEPLCPQRFTLTMMIEADWRTVHQVEGGALKGHGTLAQTMSASADAPSWTGGTASRGPGQRMAAYLDDNSLTTELKWKGTLRLEPPTIEIQSDEPKWFSIVATDSTRCGWLDQNDPQGPLVGSFNASISWSRIDPFDEAAAYFQIVVPRTHWTHTHAWETQPAWVDGGKRPPFAGVLPEDLPEAGELPMYAFVSASASTVSQDLVKLEGLEWTSHTRAGALRWAPPTAAKAVQIKGTSSGGPSSLTVGPIRCQVQLEATPAKL